MLAERRCAQHRASCALAASASPGERSTRRRNPVWSLTVYSLMHEPKGTWHFHDLARHASLLAGTPTTFLIACAIVLVWAVAGPLFGFSDTWQLVINTGTTVVTFLMVFLLQNTQNHDARALHLKLDELLRSLGKARNRFIDLESCTDEEIEELERQFRAFRAREERRRANGDAKST
jgi:low affinity Fe/Cu permease